MKTKKIPFNIERAKAGAKVVTRCGYPVRIGFYDIKGTSFPILGAVTEEDNTEIVRTFTKDGCHTSLDVKSDYDLFIEEEVEEEHNNFEINSDKWYTCIKSCATVNMKIGDWFEEGHYYLGSDILKYKGLLEEDEDYKDFFRPWSIQDAKPGDILATKNGHNILIFKNIKSSSGSGFSSYYNYNNFSDYSDFKEGSWNRVCFIPATKEQRDLLFQKMKEEGYEWDEEKKELKKIEEPKFHKGDWVVFNNQGEAHQIVRVAVNGINQIHGYDTADNYYFSVTEESVRLWDITKDAKPGDVLCCCESGWTCIFKAFVDAETFGSYCFMDADKWFYETGGEHTLKEEFVKAYNGKIRPATKEQRNLFFQKIKERGYQWDSDKKELHKIEEVKKRRMTNQELSWWLKEHPEEHREYFYEGENHIYSNCSYTFDYADEEVEECIRIRKNGGEWQEPLIEE